MAEGGSAHALLFPFPIQGHVPPMLKLAELLSHAGLHITVVLTGGVRERLSNNSPALGRLSHTPNLRFRTVPDGATREDSEPWVQVLELLDSMTAASREPYREILSPKNGRDPDGWPPVTCVVADGILPLALEVAEEQGIPVMLLRTSSACSVWAYYSIPELIKRGELPFAEGADMDEPVRGVAGMESFLRRRDLPGLLRHAKSPTDSLLGFLTTMSSGLARAEALILNTFEPLEAPVLSSIRSVCPVTYTIGPLHLLARNTAGFPSFWQQDRSCIEWLDRQPAGSVVYVSFGSITVMSGDKLLEFWHGLVSSGQRFLWVARPDLVRGLPEGATPAEVEEGTRERGCLVPWAPQEEVLAHPAVGCFLTHSGWNSTMESIAAGVPMVCWPFFADQQITSRFVGEVWGIGVDMKDVCERRTVERMVRGVMTDESGELRRAVGEMATVARETAGEGGASHVNFQRLVQHIKSLSLM